MLVVYALVDILELKTLFFDHDFASLATSDFWCRKDGENYYRFIAHPKQRKLRYPLEYGYSEKVGEVRVEALFYGNEEKSLELDFPGRGITLRLNSRADRQ